MITKQLIDNFLAAKRIAVAGASASGKGFGNNVIAELTKREYAVYPVHPTAESINGLRACNSIKKLPDGVTHLYIALKPEDALKVIKEALVHNIEAIWIQQHSESKEILSLCETLEIPVIYGQCIIMYLPNISFPHRVHRYINKLTGKLPVG